MKPQRLSALNNLVVNYGLDKHMNVKLCPRASASDMRFVSILYSYENFTHFAFFVETSKHILKFILKLFSNLSITFWKLFQWTGCK